MGFTVNAVKDNQSEWVKFPIPCEEGQEQEHIEFLIRGLYSCSDYQVALARYKRKVRADDEQLIGSDKPNFVPVDGERSEIDVQCKLMAQFIVQDWRGDIDIDRDGEIEVSAKYTPDNAYTILKSSAKLYLFILAQAQLVDARKQLAVNETVGKSPNTSTTKKTTAATAKSKPKSTGG